MSNPRSPSRRAQGTAIQVVTPPPGKAWAQRRFSLLAAPVALTFLAGIVKAGGPPPVIDSIEPAELVPGTVPQPDLVITGSNLIEGLPSETNRPTVTLRHVDGPGVAEFSTLAFVNLSGTVATVPPELMNIIIAPLGFYDVIVTRPDNESDTLAGGFAITDGLDADGPQLMVRSAWGGPVNDIAIVGNLAYAAIGRRLVVLDVADATNPIEVGSLYIPSGVGGVAVSGDYAFLGTNKPYRFTVVNVSDPTSPTLVWAGQGPSFSRDVHLYGSLAYVRDEGGGLDVFDVGAVPNVVPLSTALGTIRDVVAIVGDLLYVGTDRTQAGGGDTAEFRIYDLAADPFNPPLLGSVDSAADLGNFTDAIDVEGDSAVWIVRNEDNDNILYVVDVSDPATPLIVGSHNDGHDSQLADVVLSGGLAYVADAAFSPRDWADTKGLAVFDVATNPANPTLISTFKTHGNVQGVEVVGNRAYLHDDGEGIIILDITDPANPVRLGNYHSPSTLRQMKKVGSLLYVADAWNGFTVLDVSDATAPQVVSVYLAEREDDLGVDAMGIDVQDDLVYLGAGHLGLEVVDVSDPGSPALVGVFRIPSADPACSTFAAVTVWGDGPCYASIGFEEHFCVAVGGVFLNVDVTDPQDMFEAGRFAHGPPRASTIELNGQGIAFLGRAHLIYEGGPLTFDVSDPELPDLILSGGIQSVADVALDGNILYLASDDDDLGGLYIQDVTNPASPQLLNYINDSEPLGDGVNLNLAFSVVTHGQRLYVIGRGCTPLGGCGRQAAYLFDTSDPSTPLLLDAVPHVGGTESAVIVDEPFVSVTNEFEGPNDPSIGMVISEFVVPNSADLDGDGVVGILDFLLLLANWG